MKPTELNAWQLLANSAQHADHDLNRILADEARGDWLRLEAAGLLFDFTKQRVDANIVARLTELAEACGLAPLRDALFAGEAINLSEQRRVLHPALRGAPGIDAEILAEVETVQQQMCDAAGAIREGTWRGCSNKPITDVVHIGIGGSHLGPELVVTALEREADRSVRIHFVANIDANDLVAALAGLDPEQTLFIVVSKSFTTLETRINAESARSWFVERTGAPVEQHFIAVTSNVTAARDFGIATVLPMWDWVGGRYSLWSAVGLPILIALGESGFRELLAGAREIDEHFLTAPLRENIPVLSALLATWNANFLGATSHAILAYDERLRLLPEYLQQLEMESNGKSVTREGEDVDYHTMPILWGGVGSRGQHAYHQLLHQGTRAYAADFIVVARDDLRRPEHHDWLVANALGQSQAMALGFTPESADENHRRVPGNHPTTTIVLDALGPRQLGALLASYEHKVFCQGAIWNINSFDQWGVELGKELAKPIYAQLAGGERQGNPRDAATSELLDYLLKTKQ